MVAAGSRLLNWNKEAGKEEGREKDQWQERKKTQQITPPLMFYSLFQSVIVWEGGIQLATPWKRQRETWKSDLIRAWTVACFYREGAGDRRQEFSRAPVEEFSLCWDDTPNLTLSPSQARVRKTKIKHTERKFSSTFGLLDLLVMPPRVEVACWLLLFSALGQNHLVAGGCSGRCCRGRDLSCSATDWRMDRVYGTCYCDEDCVKTKDCCFDYFTECPGEQWRQGKWVKEPNFIRPL